MSKWLFAAIGAAVATIIAVGGTVYAQAGNSGQTMIEQAVNEGVLSQEQAENLNEFSGEHRHENRQEMMNQRIDTAVQDDTITEKEAEQIRDWCESRPETMDKIKPGQGFGKHRFQFSPEN